MKPAILVLLTAWLCQAGALRVLVRDPSGAAIANATVRAGAEVQLTDSTGSARFEGVSTGRITVSIDAEDIPDVQVRCNAGLLHVILANLCGNAVKYLEGQAERRVRVSAREEGSLCRIEVEDTGPGIPKEAQSKIFQPFFRVEGTHAPGTGIGLATVRRILDARGGRIEVESAEGRGARFIVWLTIAPPKPEAGIH